MGEKKPRCQKVMPRNGALWGKSVSEGRHVLYIHDPGAPFGAYSPSACRLRIWSTSACSCVVRLSLMRVAPPESTRNRFEQDSVSFYRRRVADSLVPSET